MLYIRIENGFPVEVGKRPKAAVDQSIWARGPDGTLKADGWLTPDDIGTFQYASTLADVLTVQLGRRFLACDAGPSRSSPFSVIEAPRVGDPVSRSLNGDTYPCGMITKVTRTFQLTTSTGVRFRRKDLTASWRETRGYFWMVHGHIDERNPSF